MNIALLFKGQRQAAQDKVEKLNKHLKLNKSFELRAFERCLIDKLTERELEFLKREGSAKILLERGLFITPFKEGIVIVNMTQFLAKVKLE